MTPMQIAELFIEAAEVDRKLPDTARPKKLRAQSLSYVHDWEDMRHWGDERHEEHRAEMFGTVKLTHRDVSNWELCNDLITFVTSEPARRSLWAWATAKAGGLPFSKWCKQNRISRETGRRRKNRAILEIFGQVARINGQNYKNGLSDVLHVDSENGHIVVNIADDEPAKQPLNWRSDKALASEEDRNFDWAEARNERRRQRYAQRQKAA